MRDRDLALLGQFVNADRSAVHGELLSYLFLAREFIDKLIALGQRDAKRWLEQRHDAGLWQVGGCPRTGEGRARSRTIELSASSARSTWSRSGPSVTPGQGLKPQSPGPEPGVTANSTIPNSVFS